MSISSKDTLFTNDSGSAGGPTDFIRDSFSDISVLPNSNTGFTDTALTNPLRSFFSNDDSVKWSQRMLWISDLQLITDRSKWIDNKPTYSIIFNESFPQVTAYVFGDFTFDGKVGSKSQPQVQFRAIGSGIGVSGVFRKVAWFVNGDTSATATGQLVLDGVPTTTIDFSQLSSDSQNFSQFRFAPFVNSATNATKDIHDYRLTALQATTLKVVGMMVYFENTGINIDVFPGTTYVDKSKINTTTGATLNFGALGSSLGGIHTIYKTQANGYAINSLAATMTQSIAQGASGTNISTVTTSTGASFPIGSGIVLDLTGGSQYIGSVVNQSTDTLTLSPTLPFGVSGLIYKTWGSGSTYAINASLFSVNATFGFSDFFGNSLPFYDPIGRFMYTGANVGFTLIDSQVAMIFLGASGYFQVDGNMSAAEFQTIGSGSLSCTLAVNGTPGWSANTNFTGMQRFTAFSDAGPGYNSFVLSPSASYTTGVGFNNFALFHRQRSSGVTFGALAEIRQQQAFVNRGAINATLMSLGTSRRVYSDQLFMQGPWVRGVTLGAAGGVQYTGSTNNCVANLQFYGANYGVVGTLGASVTMTFDGGAVGASFNVMKTATEGFHNLVVAHKNGTTIIEAIDYTMQFRGIGNLQNYNPTKPIATALSRTKSIVRMQDATAIIGVIRQFTRFIEFQGTAITALSDGTTGSRFVINEDGVYALTYLDVKTAGGIDSVSIAMNLNATEIASGVSDVTKILSTVQVNASRAIQSTTQFLRAGDVIWAVANTCDAVNTGAAFKFTIVKVD